MTNDPAIIEAAARALQKEPLLYDYPDECSEIARAIVAAVTPLIRAAALEEAAAPEGRHWRHVTSGMFVTEIGRGRMQTAEPIGDMTPVVIYHHAGENGGGTFWVRPVREFEDGRFVAFERALKEQP